MRIQREYFALFILLICFSCTSDPAGVEEEPEPEILPALLPAFTDTLNMKINGADWLETVPEEYHNSAYYDLPAAIMTEIKNTPDAGDSLFHISNFKYLVSLSFSGVDMYYDFIGFFENFDDLSNEFPMYKQQLIEGMNRGFVYGEYVAGNDIIYYYPIEAPSNSFSYEFNVDEYGRRYVEGNFAFTAVVDAARADSTYLPYRLKPDTVHITDGLFRLEVLID